MYTISSWAHMSIHSINGVYLKDKTQFSVLILNLSMHSKKSYHRCLYLVYITYDRNACDKNFSTFFAWWWGSLEVTHVKVITPVFLMVFLRWRVSHFVWRGGLSRPLKLDLMTSSPQHELLQTASHDPDAPDLWVCNFTISILNISLFLSMEQPNMYLKHSLK